jgi:hypothetical protein
MDNTVENKDVSDPSVPKAPSGLPITKVPITDENVALNVLVSFVNVAQKRGAFNLDESAKIWECIQKFVVLPPNPNPNPSSETINI